MADMGLFGVGEPMSYAPVMGMRTLPQSIVTNPPRHRTIADMMRSPVIPGEHYGQFGPHPYGRPVASERTSSLPAKAKKIAGEQHAQFVGKGSKVPPSLGGKATERSSSLKDKRPAVKSKPRKNKSMGLFGASKTLTLNQL